MTQTAQRRILADRQRGLILLVWLLGFCLNLILVAYLDSSQYRAVEDPPENFREPVNRLYTDYSALYVTFLTTMLGITFARKKLSAPLGEPQKWIFQVAIWISGVWNCFLVYQTARVACLHTLDIQDLAGVVESFVKGTSFVVAPVVAYYFASEPPR